MTQRTKDQSAPPQRTEPDSMNWRDFDPSCLPCGALTPLAIELVTYRDNLDELLKHQGQFVVIKGTTILGIYPRRSTALAVTRAAGKPEQGNDPIPVLLKQIVETEPIRWLGNVVL